MTCRRISKNNYEIQQREKYIRPVYSQQGENHSELSDSGRKDAWTFDELDKKNIYKSFSQESCSIQYDNGDTSFSVLVTFLLCYASRCSLGVILSKLVFLGI